MKTKIIFYLSLTIVAFFLGAAVMSFTIFPYSYLNEASLAARSHFKILEAKLDNKPVLFLKKQQNNNFADAPVARNAVSPDESLFLMTGGPYQLTSHCPEYGCLAWITDRQGNIKHTWPLNSKKLWANTSLGRWVEIDDIYPVGLHLYPNGDLLASFQTRNSQQYAVAIVKFNKDGEIIWQRNNQSHHWFSLDESGNIYVPGSNTISTSYPLGNTRLSLKCSANLHDDVIRIFNPDGELIDEISLLESLSVSGYAGALHTGKGIVDYHNCDVTHLNDVQVLSQEMAAQYPGLTAGDMLISARNINTLAVIDGRTHKIKWLTQGLTIGQHSPSFIGNNKILVFDNKGGSTGLSQISLIDLRRHTKDILAPKSGTQGAKNFDSIVAGHVQLSASKKRLLVTLSMSARVFEIDILSGKIIWSYLNSQRLPEKFFYKKEGKIINSGLFQQWAAYYANNTNFTFNQE